MLRCALFASAALVVLPTTVFAQSPSQVVPPTRADQATPGTTRTPQPAAPRRGRAAAPALTPFTLKSVTVTGSTLPTGELRSAYAPFLEQTMDASKIQALSDAIAARYETTDVALYTVLIPNQDLSGGNLNITVLEGRITGLQIDTANAGKAGDLVTAYAEGAKGEAPLRRSTLQRQISLIRDIPGLTTGMDLLNGEADNGVTLKLDPTLQPVQVAIGVNTRGTAFLGRTQVQGDLYLNSFLRGGDQTRFTVAVPTEDDLFRFAALSHTTPVGVNGDTVLFSASYLRTEPATTALVGRAVSFGVQYTRPVIRSFDRDFFITLGIDGLNSDNALFGRQFSDDRTRAVRLAAAYSRTKPKAVSYIVGSVSRGVDGLGARTTAPAFTDLEFTKFNVRAGYNLALGEKTALRLKAAGQASDDVLPGSEQFALGGPEYGRAYESSIVSGDTGYAGSAELAYRPSALPQNLAGSEVYTFVDGGRVQYKARSVFAGADYRLGSIGAGVRVNVKKAIIEVEGAKGLSSDTAFLDNRDWRGVVSLRTLF